MTLVTGQKFFRGVVLVSDSRVSFCNEDKFVISKADIAQKLFLVSDKCVIGFSGDFSFAAVILRFILERAREDGRWGNPHVLREELPFLIKSLYTRLSDESNSSPPVVFVVGGIDPSERISYKNKDGSFGGYFANMFEGELFSIRCPGFDIREAENFKAPLISVGSGENAARNVEDHLSKLEFDINPNMPLDWIAGIISDSLKKEIKRCEIDTVGGMYQIAVIDRNGARLIPYKSRSEENDGEDLDLELRVGDNGRLVQKNLESSEEVELLFPPEVVNISEPVEKIFARAKDELENN